MGSGVLGNIAHLLQVLTKLRTKHFGRIPAHGPTFSELNIIDKQCGYRSLDIFMWFFLDYLLAGAYLSKNRISLLCTYKRKQKVHFVTWHCFSYQDIIIILLCFSASLVCLPTLFHQGRNIILYLQMKCLLMLLQRFGSRSLIAFEWSNTGIQAVWKLKANLQTRIKGTTDKDFRSLWREWFRNYSLP